MFVFQMNKQDNGQTGRYRKKEKKKGGHIQPCASILKLQSYTLPAFI
jgi:hypothetical protein